MSAVEFRDAGGGKLALTGMASAHEKWYSVGGRFEERMRAGVWKRCLNNPATDTVLLIDHDGLALARTKTPSGVPTLRLSETGEGLHAEAVLDASNPRVAEIRSVAANSGLQMSVGMRVEDDVWGEAPDGTPRREIKLASLHKGDITVCNFGANPFTAATVDARTGTVSAAERRGYEDLKGTSERRMAPVEWELARGRSQISVPRPAGEASLPVTPDYALRARVRRLAAGTSSRPAPGPAKTTPSTVPIDYALRARARKLAAKTSARSIANARRRRAS